MGEGGPLRRVVVATGNPGKLREFALALSEAGLEVLVVTFSPEHFGMALAVIPIVLVARLVAVAIDAQQVTLVVLHLRHAVGRLDGGRGLLHHLPWPGLRG